MEEPKIGDLVKVLDTPNVRAFDREGKGIGHTFILTSTVDIIIDPDNKYRTNYILSDLVKIEGTPQKEDFVKMVNECNTFETAEPQECENCDGTGRIMETKLYPYEHTEVNVECPECEGIGEVNVLVERRKPTEDIVMIIRGGHGINPNDEGKPIIKLSFKPFTDEPLSDYYNSYCRKIDDISYITGSSKSRQYINCSDISFRAITEEERQKFFINSQLKPTEHVGNNNKSVQLRSTAPKIGQGEGHRESGIQSRKSKVKLAEFDPLNERGVSYRKAKGCRL